MIKLTKTCGKNDKHDKTRGKNDKIDEKRKRHQIQEITNKKCSMS